MPNKIDLTGKRFGHWVVLYETRVNNKIMWRCRCDCGKEKNVSGNNLRRGVSSSCGCGNISDYIGKKYGLLTILGYGKPKITNGKHIIKTWKCKCECGNVVDLIPSRIKAGKTNSCGCLKIKCISDRMRAKNHNLYDINSAEEYGIGYTNNGTKFKFDKEDYCKLKEYCWFLNNSGYLSAKIRGTNKHIMMHNLVMNGLYVDHINNDKCDNRKSNLRFGAQKYSFDSYNQMNKALQSNNKSGCAGVTWHKRDCIWEVNISVGNKQYYIGRFNNFDEAVAARRNAEEEYFGEYSYLNSQKKDKKEA